MKFYNRENELAELQRIQELSFGENSRLTVVTGRRRIGKTSLIMRAFEKTPTIYLFVGRKNEAYRDGGLEADQCVRCFYRGG